MSKRTTSKAAINQGASQIQGAWNQLQGDALNKALADYGKGIRESISLKGGGFTNQSMDVQQGLAAEAHHVGSFNIEAAAKGQNNHRATRGVANDPKADILLKTPDGATEHQVKFYKDGEKTAAALSPEKYDNVGKIVPEDQLESVKISARKQALRNKETRPNASKSNQHTADNVTDTLTSSDNKVSSTSLKRRGKGSAEGLVKEAKTNENGPDYKDKGRVRSEFNSMQYRNAAKAGAIAGGVTESAVILLDILRSDKPLTRHQCMDAAQRVVASSVMGAGNALLITSIQHAGQAMIDAAAHQSTKAVGQAIGKQLIKGNVAAALAQITVQLADNLYKFSAGEIDNLQFTSSTIGGAVQVVGGSLAFSVGTGAGAYLGATVPAAISGYAIAGTTLGTLGVMASGTVFAVGFAVAAGAYVNHFSSKGTEIAHADLKSAMELLNGGEIDLSTYVGKIGTMSDLNFNWHDILPFSGAISVISEYGQRKRNLVAAQRSILDQLNALPEQEHAIIRELIRQYENAITNIDRQYDEARNSITRQALNQFDALGKDLSRHLETRYLLFKPVRKNYIEHSCLMDIELRKEQENNERSQAFAHELEELQNRLEGVTVSNEVDRTIRQELQRTILSRMQVLIPRTTGWDQACEFLELQ